MLLDGLGCRGQLNSSGRDNFLQEIQMFLQELLVTNGCQMSLNCSLASISCDGYLVGIHPFFVKKGLYCSHVCMHNVLVMLKICMQPVHLYLMRSLPLSFRLMTVPSMNVMFCLHLRWLLHC